jgi:PAS domain S-box-containing protein
MKRFSLGSLRVRLCLVVLLAVIPSLGLIYYSAREQRAAANALAWQDIARIARLTAEYQRAVIEDTHQLLVVLAQLPVIRDVDPSRGGPMLGKLLGEYPLYSNLGVVASDGNVLCSAIPLKEPVSVADSPWFQQAMKTRDFAVGEYQMSAFSSYPLLNFGYPIVGSDDRASRVVFASLDIAYLIRQMSFVLPAEGAELAVVNRNGVILGQTGGREDRVGRTTPEAAVIKEASAQRGGGAGRFFDPTGIERIYAFHPIGGRRAGVDLYVTTSMPTAIAFADANRQLKKNLIALAVVALLALVGAWYGGEAIVLRRANDDLERRVQERTKELAHEQFLLRTLLDNVPDSIYFKDLQGRFLRSSRAQSKRFGLSDPAQAIGKTDFDFFSPEHAKEAATDEQQIIQTGQPLISVEENSPLADGTERWVSTSKLPLRDARGDIVGTFGISREITERKQAEQALAKERNMLLTLIDNLPDVVFIKDSKGRYVFDNAAHRAFLAVGTLDDIVGKTVFDFYTKEQAAPLHADDQAVLAGGVPVLNRDEYLTDRKGRKIRVATSKVPYRDEQRRIVGLVCISHVLGELK